MRARIPEKGLPLHRHRPVLHVQIIDIEREVQRIVRQREKRVLVPHQIQKQRQLERPNRRASQHKHTRKLDNTRQNRIRPHADMLQILNEIRKLNSSLVLARPNLPSRNLRHPATPTGTILIDSHMHILRATRPERSRPLSKVMIGRQDYRARARVIQHPTELRRNLPKQAAPEVPVPVPQANEGRFPPPTCPLSALRKRRRINTLRRDRIA